VHVRGDETLRGTAAEPAEEMVKQNITAAGPVISAMNESSEPLQATGSDSVDLDSVVACAGKDIRVVTDMGFDDWGAFSVLQAAGCTPTHALATKGMMLPSDFADDFSKLLQSWNLTTKVHMGSEACYDSKQCIDTFFISDDWGYRKNIMDTLPSATGPTVPGCSNCPTNVFPAADFWRCQSGQKFTLLVISPLSDVAIELSQNSEARGCIDEVVMMGGFLATSQEGKVVLTGGDMSTQKALMDGIVPPMKTSLGDTELNVASDIKAAQAVFGLDIPLRMVPLEVASIDRVGKQLIPGTYSEEEQVSLTTDQLAKLCKSAPGATMLKRMACIHASGGDKATMDMDAIAATFLWTGDKHFEFKNGTVKVQRSGRTEVCPLDSDDRKCQKAHMASQFDAVGWFQDLSNLVAQ